MKDLGHAFENVDKELPNNLPSAIGVLRYSDRSVIVENIPVGTLDYFTLPQPNQMLEPSNFAVNYIVASGLNFDNTPQATPPGIWKRSLRSNVDSADQKIHHDYPKSVSPDRHLVGLMCNNVGQHPRGTRLFDLTTTALYNPFIATLLSKHTGVDLSLVTPQDWSYFSQSEHKQGYGLFWEELRQSSVNIQEKYRETDANGGLVLLNRSQLLLFNDRRFVHGRASHLSTEIALPKDTLEFLTKGEREMEHYVTNFDARANHLACLRASALQQVNR